MGSKTDSSLINDHGLLAKPIHLQRLEKALRLDPFLSHMEKVLHRPISDDSESDLEPSDSKNTNAVCNLPNERTDLLRLYNFSKVKKGRKWLKNVLTSDSSDSEENADTSLADNDDIQEMLKLHKLKKIARKEYNENSEQLKQYQYMSVGILSNYDRFSEHNKQRKEIKNKKVEKKNKFKRPKIDKDNLEEGVQDNLEPLILEEKIKTEKCPPKKKAPTLASLALKRKRIWITISKKEIARSHKQRAASRKDVFSIKKKLAQACVKERRKLALCSEKTTKEIASKAKRLSKEMLLYWKRYDKVEKEHRKRAEREAQEQLRLNMELLEAKRQQRKLNFLITQTELYSHFMSRKLDKSGAETILDSLKEPDKDKANLPIHPCLQDDYDSDKMKALAMKAAETAFQAQKSKVDAFDDEMVSLQNRPKESFAGYEQDLPQPKMFVGVLKTYQVKGMTWLYNLYDKGINGILADEMGLGKTIQTIAFLATLVEKQDVWGPFLIIAPASTLHNWQQEFTKFVPSFKVLPYWGNAVDRRILRKFWTQKDLHTMNASFHVMITSYQLVIQDMKYFQRIKWQYMVLDEAQAIKSSSSVRWKLLLCFNCRNRLLLTGTPIQNSMSELWALLHFIMPTLFDSHTEFDEWFSKEIENHSDKTAIDEKHLSRLHMILKPFMLRRIKKDVENELSDKIEILKYCYQTRRQQRLYHTLRNKICLREILHPPSSSSSSSSSSSHSSSLMNLVMQFRKVCNHPDLFERREIKSPFYLEPPPLTLPKLIYDWSEDLAYKNFINLFSPANIHQTLYSASTSNFFDFSCLLGLSASQMFSIVCGGFLVRLKFALDSPTKPLIDIPPDLIFGSFLDSVYSFLPHKVFSMRETLEHLKIRQRKSQVTFLPFVERPPKIQELQPTLLPRFLYNVAVPRVIAPSQTIYSNCLKWEKKKSQPTTIPQFIYNGIHNHSEWLSMSPAGLFGSKPPHGWSFIQIPDRESLVYDSGKLRVLDNLLKELKSGGHRVLIYSQMTKMIDILEEYMCYRKHTYSRLDGSSKLAERRDMVADFQSREDIFAFLLSTRAGGLGINLTAADTVIFYDSDWNPTVDQQAMDRAHRLGQTKQVTVYRLICKGTIEERILQRAREKSEIQRMVISGGSWRPESLKPTEVVSLLLDEEELEKTIYQQHAVNNSRKRKLTKTSQQPPAKKLSNVQASKDTAPQDDSSSEGPLVMDESVPLKEPARRGRGRPRGSGKRGARSTSLTTAAAELAAAKAGTTAGFAAYGYMVPGGGAGPLIPTGALPRPMRGTRGKRLCKPVPDSTPRPFGFYLPQNSNL